MVQEIKLDKNGRRHGGGGKTLPFLEKKVMIYGLVKRKHHKEAQALVTELLKKWR